MNKIRIAHLYYDLMNLYGENGNIMALVKGFEAQDMFTEVVNLTVGDNEVSIVLNNDSVLTIGTYSGEKTGSRHGCYFGN